MNHLKDILQNILKNQFKNNKDRENEFNLYKDWETIVGKRIAKNCWPVKWINNETLLIATESSVWLHELKRMDKVLLQKIKASTQNQKINRLVFKIDQPERTD